MTARVAIEPGRLTIHRTGAARWFGAPVDVPLVHVCFVHAADPQDVKRWNEGMRLAGIQITDPAAVTRTLDQAIPALPAGAIGR